MSGAASPKGGAWLVEQAQAADVVTPERRTGEHRLIGQSAAEFMDGEVLPVAERLEQKEWALNRDLLRKCGELGLLGTNVPEAYGGVDLDKIATLIVSEQLARYASFAVTFGAQANLCILPIFMFGTETQRQRYLPPLVAGEMVGAYCLSESGSGSDALGARARAVPQDDGSFRLSGEKMWISNGGFADLFIVFAKVDGGPSTGSGSARAESRAEQFTAFIVERDWPGVSIGKEEHKMGLHGSSTTPVILQDVPVPADAVLGAIGRGHKVAFNVLNFGRFKLGAMTAGGAKGAIGEAARYAASRKQFGVAIGSFGAIRHKLGEMTARAYALESMVYRTAGLMDAHIAAKGADSSDAAPLLAALEEFAVEASIAKVMGSEVAGFAIDENVQIHGGNGFVRDYPAEGHYRDARVNRIFEGTNEINRLLIPGMLIKKALKGELPLLQAAKALQDEIMSPSLAAVEDEGSLAAELRASAAFKKVVLLVAGTAMQKYGQALEQEQEVLTFIADLVIDTYAAESAVLRAMAQAGAASAAGLHADAATVFVHEAAGRVELNARTALAAMADGDTLRTQLAALRRLLKLVPADTVSRRRRLADATLGAGKYLFD